MMVVDVLAAYLDPTVNGNSDQGVRSVLTPLAGVADRTGCLIVLIRHLNKRTGDNALYRGGGSIGIIGAARATFLIGPDPRD
jgi:hypothetical protein